MHKAVNIKGKSFKRGFHYELGDGIFARVVMTPKDGPVDRYQIEVQVIQVDAKGHIVEDADGLPVCNKPQMMVVARAGLGDTQTLTPGWVRVPENPRIKVEFEVDTLPESAVVGVVYHNTTDGNYYRYEHGVLEGMRQAALDAFKGRIVAVESAPTQLLDL